MHKNVILLMFGEGKHNGKQRNVFPLFTEKSQNIKAYFYFKIQKKNKRNVFASLVLKVYFEYIKILILQRFASRYLLQPVQAFSRYRHSL